MKDEWRSSYVTKTSWSFIDFFEGKTFWRKRPVPRHNMPPSWITAMRWKFQLKMFFESASKKASLATLWAWNWYSTHISSTWWPACHRLYVLGWLEQRQPFAHSKHSYEKLETHNLYRIDSNWAPSACWWQLYGPRYAFWLTRKN